MLKMKLVDSMSRHLTPSTLLNSLLPSSVEARILRERIQNIFFNYAWDFNNEENRKNIIRELEITLALEKNIEDRTTPENADMGFLNFIINHGGEELTITKYLEKIEAKKRFES